MQWVEHHKPNLGHPIAENRKRKKGDKELTSVEKIQVKLVSNKSGSNQIERKYVDSYKGIWHMPDDIADILLFSARFCRDFFI